MSVAAHHRRPLLSAALGLRPSVVARVASPASPSPSSACPTSGERGAARLMLILPIAKLRRR
jgi:hypothetical protein